MRTKAVCERHLEKIQDIADKVRTNTEYGRIDAQYITKMMNAIDTYVEYLENLIDQESDN
jgi:protoheme ferro-lyase